MAMDLTQLLRLLEWQTSQRDINWKAYMRHTPLRGITLLPVRMKINNWSWSTVSLMSQQNTILSSTTWSNWLPFGTLNHWSLHTFILCPKSSKTSSPASSRFKHSTKWHNNLHKILNIIWRTLIKHQTTDMQHKIHKKISRKKEKHSLSSTKYCLWFSLLFDT